MSNEQNTLSPAHIEDGAQLSQPDCVTQARSLLSLDESNALVPHGIGGLAREVIRNLIQHIESAALSAPHEQAELWAVHVEGPDDLYAAFSQEDAERHANELNAIKVPDGISISAVVIPSPWGAVEHWQYLAEQEREHVESMRAALATPPAAGVPEGWKAGFEWHEIKDALAAGLPEPDAWLETCDGENMHPVLRSHPMVWHSFYASRFWPLYRPGSLPAALTPPASEQQRAVVMPERGVYPSMSMYPDGKEYAAAVGEVSGRNACLDELLRLNPHLAKGEGV